MLSREPSELGELAPSVASSGDDLEHTAEMNYRYQKVMLLLCTVKV